MKLLKKITRVARIVFAVLVISAAVLAAVFFATGGRMYVVRSGSMAPVINAGDLAFVAPANSLWGATPKMGSIITYRLSTIVVTHRVVAVNAEGYITKGDANEDPDGIPVERSQVMGRYLFKLPGAGYVNNYIRTRTGWLLCIIIPSAALMGLIVKDILKEAFKKEEPAQAAADCNAEGVLPDAKEKGAREPAGKPQNESGASK